MNLNTIEMPQAEARAAFEEYRKAVRSAKTSATNAEDAQIARAYKALAEGKAVLNIEEAFTTAGYDDRGLPRLAISRADYQHVAITARSVGPRVLEMGPENKVGWQRRAGAVLEGQIFRIPVGEIKPSFQTMYAVVPNIPPHLRPPHDLKNYHLLWEPEWRTRPRPPGDPALLKWLGGPLYAVLAVWDLTPVEQAVLGVTRAR